MYGFRRRADLGLSVRLHIRAFALVNEIVSIAGSGITVSPCPHAVQRCLLPPVRRVRRRAGSLRRAVARLGGAITSLRVNIAMLRAHENPFDLISAGGEGRLTRISGDIPAVGGPVPVVGELLAPVGCPVPFVRSLSGVG